MGNLDGEKDDDEFRWLEELDSPAAMDWVRERNRETMAGVAGSGHFAALRDALREVLDATDRIPVPTRRDQRLYNHWRDAGHPRGVWRRTTVEAYRGPVEPDWEILLDLDELAEREGENWVWQGATLLGPDDRRALVSLSRGGTDAMVVREFDVDERTFVRDGFIVPEAKSDVCWIDFDHIFVATDFGPGTLTISGHPRQARRWRRGTPLTAAELVIEGRDTDIAVYAFHDRTPGFARDLVGRRTDFFRGVHYTLDGDGKPVRIPVPDDASFDTHREWLVVRLRSPWTVAGASYPAGALLVTRFADFLAGKGELETLFIPDERTALSGYHWTRNHLILVLLNDVRTELVACTPEPTGWRREPLTGLPALDHTEIVSTDPDHSDDYLYTSTGYLQPTTLGLGQVGGGTEALKREPDYFDPAPYTVRQLFATSADGTRVPYFLVGPPGDGPAPTLLTGYGGFEIALTPGYSGIIGRGWLARGGRYVVANIRGGGEYGPRWHRAALRERRLRAYEDFAAVAEDLVRRGLTEPDRLGICGGSNGGLLMGVMLTRYPELFGAVVGQVPLLDMRRYHRLLAGALWVAEYGDPDIPADWAFLREYSPYQNIRAGRPYPPSLWLTSTRDDRVHPGHARKMVARLRAHGYDVSYHENVEGGHAAAANNAQTATKWALILEFLWSRLAG